MASEDVSPKLSQMKQAEMELQKDCEKMWSHINQVHERVNKKPSLGVLGDAENPFLPIFKAKDEHAKGELHTLNSAQPQVLPTNPTILKALLQKELMISNEELEQTLQATQAQRKELEEEIAREKAILEERQEIKRTLESKLEVASEEESNPTSQSRGSQEKEIHRQRSATEQQQKLMRNLAEFVSKSFPKPKDRPKQTSGGRAKEYMSLLEILEILMNKCTDSESDPYVTVDDTCWPPYIELLLRCGLALRHPQDFKRIRLVAFHL